MEQVDKDFILRIPLRLFNSFHEPMQREVFLAMYSFMDNGKRECFASPRKIANRAKCSLQTVQRIIPSLNKHLKVTGSQSVRGGQVKTYALSDSWSVSEIGIVTDGDSEVTDEKGQPQAKQLNKQLNKQLSTQQQFHKPNSIRDQTWEETQSSYQVVVNRSHAKRDSEPLFISILEKVAFRLNDTAAIAFIAQRLSDEQLLVRVKQPSANGGRTQEYFVEAMRRGLKWN